MAEFLRFPNFQGCKVTDGTLLSPGIARVTHLTPPTDRPEDIPLKMGDMEVVEIPCRKVLVEKKKKKKKAEAKAAAKVNDDDQVEKVTEKKRVSEEGTSRKKKRKTRLGTPTINLDSEHEPNRRAKPLPHNVVNDNVDIHMVDGDAGHEQGDENVVGEGHGDNTDGLSGLRRNLEFVEKSACDRAIVETTASYSAGRFGDLPFTPHGVSPIRARWIILATVEISDALLDYEANRNSGNRNGNGNGNRNGNGNDNGNKSHDSGSEARNRVVMASDKVERYVGGLPDNIQGNVMASKPKMLQDAIELARSLMDQKVCAYAARQADNKRRIDNNLGDNHAQQPPYKRQNVARAYTVGPSEKKEYAGTLPLCNKCKLHHNGPCTVKRMNCKRVGHSTRDCRSPTATTNQRTLTCFKCGNQGHYRSEYPRLKNQNCKNQTGNGEARGRVYALGGGEADQDPSSIADEIDA
ncbi:hypothetical protein Tco_0538256 [Tanacetum coccineum]